MGAVTDHERPDTEHDPGPRAEDGAAPGDPPAREPDPPAREPEPAAAEAQAAEEPAPERRPIWDPQSGRWLQPEEIAAPEPAAAATAPAPAGTAPASAPAAAQQPAPPAPSARPPAAAKPAGVAPVLVAGLLGAVLGIVAMLFVPGVVDRRPLELRPTPRPAPGSTGPSDASAVAETARASVVSVAVVGSTSSLTGTQAFQRSGTGVVLRANGVIATPTRLVDGATQITVGFPDGSSAEAELAGADRESDVAVLRVPRDELTPVQPASPADARLGDPVLAVMTPAGAQSVVVVGAISAFGRTVDAGESEVLLDMIQIDGPLASGGSGGVLMNASQTAVGMTASVSDRSGAVGYAIPFGVVRAVADQILEGRKPSHPYIGMSVEPAASGEGLRVNGVFKDSPAAKADIAVGAVVLAIEGEESIGPLSLVAAVADQKIGGTITLRVRQGGNEREVAVTVEERPPLG